VKFYDLHVHSSFSGGESSIEQLAEVAHLLGYKGFCFSAHYEGDGQIKKIQADIEKARAKFPVEIYLGLEAGERRDVERLRQIRRRFDILLVKGGDLEMNRLAVETPEVDILTHPEFNRNDTGMNDTLLRMAAKNNVAIEINFREIINSSRSTRAKILRNVSQNVIMARKVKAPVVVCSGALSHYEMKDPMVLVSLANVLGLEMKDAKAALSSVPEAGLVESAGRKDEKWVMPGVKEI
jgi:ribonuclease P/MRP protein subunit RPP1